MKWEKNNCPKCGGPPVGVIESVDGDASLLPDGKGGFEYASETRINWDSLEPVEVSGRNILTCDKGHSWESRQVEKEGKVLPENNEENREKLAQAVVDAADIEDTIGMAVQGCVDRYEGDDDKFLEDWEVFFPVEEQNAKEQNSKQTESKE